MSLDASRRNAPADQSDSVAIWMPWFIKDHRAVASTLSHLEHSALCYFNMLIWEHGGQVHNDDKFLARHLRLSAKQWKTMRDTILHNCTIAGGVISHPVLTAEVAKAKVNVEQKRKAGRASAEARKNQRDGNGCSTAVATAVQPRAGGGEGEGPYQGKGSLVESYTAREDVNPFGVIQGGK